MDGAVASGHHLFQFSLRSQGKKTMQAERRSTAVSILQSIWFAPFDGADIASHGARADQTAGSELGNSGFASGRTIL